MTTKDKIKRNRVNLRIIIPVLLYATFLITPGGTMSITQRINAGALLMTILWWATGWVDRTKAAIFLLSVFLIFGHTEITQVLSFPLSSNFILVICAFLLSQGIVTSGVANRTAIKIIARFAHTPLRLIVMSFVLGVLLIFFIPHPFPRVIILATIYQSFLKKQQLNKKQNGVLLFSIFVAATCTPLILLNGDMMLNYVAIGCANLEVSWGEWARLMALPTSLATVVIIFLFIMMFWKEIKDMNFKTVMDHQLLNPLNHAEKGAFITMAVVMLLWMTEVWHGMPAAYVALGGTLSMYGLKLLNFTDLKKLNWGLLIFLTAAFAIGKVMQATGLADLLQSFFANFIKFSPSWPFYVMIIAMVMFLHMVLGSCVTTLSVAVPTLLAISEGMIQPLIIVYIAYFTVAVHYLLPFHQVTIIIGSGENYFSNAQVLRYGLVMTIAVFAIILLIYLPWWRWVGMLA